MFQDIPEAGFATGLGLGFLRSSRDSEEMEKASFLTVRRGKNPIYEVRHQLSGQIIR